MQYVYCKAFDANGPVTTDAANITGKVALDNATFANITTNTATHIDNGVYRFTLSPGEQSATSAVFDFTSATAGVSVLKISALDTPPTADSISDAVDAKLAAKLSTITKKLFRIGK